MDLPALQLRPPEQQDLLGNYAKMVQLKSLLQNQQFQQQMQPMQVQQAQLQTQQQQLAANDQQAASKAMREWNGQDMNQLPGLIMKHGGSAQAVLGAKTQILKYQTDLSQLTKDQLANEKIKNDYFAQSIENVKGLPAEQQPQAFEAAKADAVQKGHLDPQAAQQLQYQGPQQLDMLEKTFMGHAAATEQALKTAQTQQATARTQEAQANTQKTQQEMAMGGTGAMADARYRNILMKQTQKQPISQEEEAFKAAYEKQKLLVPVASANVRIAGFQQMREYPVINKQTGELEMRNAQEINASPGGYAPAGQGAKAMGQTALIEDIRGNIQQVRESLQNAKMPEFTASQRAEIAVALGGREPSTAISAAFRGSVLGSLTPEQQDYLINMAQLKENAMAMRSVLGAGQGSEDLRSAITATLPGPRTPTKAYGLQQLDKFEKVLDRLGRGIPGVPLRPQKVGAATQSNSGGQSGPKVGDVEDGYRFKGGNPSDPNSWEKAK